MKGSLRVGGSGTAVLSRRASTLALGAGAALAGALAPQFLGILGIAIAFTPVLVAALLRRGLNVGCLAVPASLCAFVPEPTAPVPPSPGPVLLVGRVVSRLAVDDVRGNVRCVVARGAARARCVFARGTSLRPGDEVRAFGTLAARSTGAPVVTVPDGGVLHVRAARSLSAAAESLRLALHAALLRAVPGRHGRVLTQLVLGHGNEVDVDIADAHRATGLSHLLAVSGAHVSLLAGMLTVLLRGARRPLHTPWLVLVAVALYGTITGLDPPVVRALVGFALMLVAQRSGRRLPVLGALAAPGILTALLEPLDTRSASFALSYAAVAGLSLTPIPPLPCSRWRALAYGFAASAWATLATAPITLHLFGQLAPWTILATPLLSPLVAFMLALGLVVAAIGAFDGTTDLLAWPLRAAVSAYMTCVEHLAELPGAPVLAICQPPLPALAASALLGVLALLLWPGRRSAAALCVLLSLPHFVPWPQPHTEGLAVLDVGHGQACVLRLPQQRIVVVDCGSLNQPSRAAHALTRAIAPRRHVDLVVLTHADADHTNGLPLLLRRARVDAVAMPSEMQDSRTAQAVLRAGARLVLVRPGERATPAPNITLTRSAPPASTRSNDLGLWVHADLGTFTVWLPGDAEEDGVRAWLNSPHPRRADVLLLPHHGRTHGAITPLLDAVRPRLALVSGGEPTTAAPQSSIARRRGIRVLETGQVGDIQVDASDPPQVRAARPEPMMRGTSQAR